MSIDGYLYYSNNKLYSLQRIDIPFKNLVDKPSFNLPNNTKYSYQILKGISIYQINLNNSKINNIIYNCNQNTQKNIFGKKIIFIKRIDYKLNKIKNTNKTIKIIDSQIYSEFIPIYNINNFCKGEKYHLSSLSFNKHSKLLFNIF